MRDKKKLLTFFLPIICGLIMASQLIAQEVALEKAKLEVMCSKNIEVFCTLINLTDYWDKRPSSFPFAIEARERFLPFQNHEAVKMTQKLLKKRWIWHNFFCHIALYHSDFPQAKLVHQFRQMSANRFINWMATKYMQIKITNYIPAVRDFYQKSEYEKFWQEKQGFYQELKANLDEKIKDINIVKIMEDFYGMKKQRYFIVPSPQMPMMALNVEAFSDGKPLAYDVQGPFNIEGEGADYFAARGALVDTAFHELGHTFLESVLHRHKKLLKKHSYIYEKLEETTKEKMRKMGYRTWDRVFIENLIRAVQARLWKKASNEKWRQWILNESPKRGFQLIPIIYDILEEYEKNREKYKDFESFFPEIFIKLSQKIKK